MKIVNRKEVFFAGTLLVIYIVNKVYLRTVIDHFFVDGYFNDLLGGILFALAVVVVCRFWLNVEMPNTYICVLTVLAGVFWEYITPLYLKYSVTDNYDIFCYGLGSLIYVLVKNGLRKNDRRKKHG